MYVVVSQERSCGMLSLLTAHENAGCAVVKALAGVVVVVVVRTIAVVTIIVVLGLRQIAQTNALQCFLQQVGRVDGAALWFAGTGINGCFG